MNRLACVLVATLLLAAGCSGGSDSGANEATTAASTEAASTSGTAVAVPTLQLFFSDQNTGPWRKRVTLELRDDLIPVTFFACGIAAEGDPTAACDPTPDTALPDGTQLRLEQRPKADAAAIPGSPGWGTVGSSDATSLSVPLSNFVSGNKTGTISYRLTLRPLGGGEALAVSNVARVTWQD